MPKGMVVPCVVDAPLHPLFVPLALHIALSVQDCLSTMGENDSFPSEPLGCDLHQFDILAN